MLEKGRWYRNPGGGVLFVERVSFSTAEVRIYNGKVRHERFATRAGEEVSFSANDVKRTAIAPGSVLEPASEEEVERFTTEKHRSRPNGKKELKEKASSALMPERPEYVEDEHLEFLDELRKDGVTSEKAARGYLQRKFELCSDEAWGILSYWMETFGKEGR